MIDWKPRAAYFEGGLAATPETSKCAPRNRLATPMKARVG